MMLKRDLLPKFVRLLLVHTANTATHCNTLQYTATLQGDIDDVEVRFAAEVRAAAAGAHWNTLQHTATHCNTLQHCRATLMMVKRGLLLEFVRLLLVHTVNTATRCNTLQCTATLQGDIDDVEARFAAEVRAAAAGAHCNTLQHTATHSNTLQHAAAHCKVTIMM